MVEIDFSKEVLEQIREKGLNPNNGRPLGEQGRPSKEWLEFLEFQEFRSRRESLQFMGSNEQSNPFQNSASRRGFDSNNFTLRSLETAGGEDGSEALLRLIGSDNPQLAAATKILSSQAGKIGIGAGIILFIYVLWQVEKKITDFPNLLHSGLGILQSIGSWWKQKAAENLQDMVNTAGDFLGDIPDRFKQLWDILGIQGMLPEEFFKLTAAIGDLTKDVNPKNLAELYFDKAIENYNDSITTLENSKEKIEAKAEQSIEKIKQAGSNIDIDTAVDKVTQEAKEKVDKVTDSINKAKKVFGDLF